jgi:hypothetical protein
MTKKQPSWWEKNIDGIFIGIFLTLFAIVVGLWFQWLREPNQQPPQLNWTCAEWENASYMP